MSKECDFPLKPSVAEVTLDHLRQSTSIDARDLTEIPLAKRQWLKDHVIYSYYSEARELGAEIKARSILKEEGVIVSKHRWAEKKEKHGKRKI